MLLINFHSVQLASKRLRASCVKFSRHWNHTTLDCGMYGFMIFLASSSRFIGKIVITPGLQRGNCGSLKGERMPKKIDRDNLTTRWKTIQDLCSVIACHSAFEDCMDGDGVGLGRRHSVINLSLLTMVEENSWPLIVLSTWIVDFLEELMRECVLLGDSREGLGEEVTGMSWVRDCSDAS